MKKYYCQASQVIQVINALCLQIVLLAGLFGCSSYINYIDPVDYKAESGWVNDNTFQFEGVSRWDVDKYFLHRYESANGRTPDRLVKLRRKYNTAFRDKALDYSSEVLGKIMYSMNSDKSVKDWVATIKTSLNQMGDLKIFIVQETYERTGDIRFVLQLKYNNLRLLLDERKLIKESR